MSKRLFEKGRGIMPACDVPLNVFLDIVEATKDNPKIVGYKLGFSLALSEGIKQRYNFLSELDKNLLYNHKGGCTDIPDTAKVFVEAIKHPKIKGVVFTPLSGPAAQENWIKTAKDAGLEVYVEPAFYGQSFFEHVGGYVSEENVKKIITSSVAQGANGIILDERLIYLMDDMEFNPKIRLIRRENDEYINSSKLNILEIGFEGILYDGLKSIMQKMPDVSGKNKKIIYDHQKAGTYSQTFAKNFALNLSEFVDGAILFPMAGLEAQFAYTKNLQYNGVTPIIGGLMTHPKFLESEGGYLNDSIVEKVYRNAVETGVKDFVVPGTKPEQITKIREMIESKGLDDPTLMYPGVITQENGDMSKAAEAAGDNSIAIVGRALYFNKAENRYNTVEEIKIASDLMTKDL